MLNSKAIRSYFKNTPGKSNVGLAKYMGLAINTTRDRIVNGDCMISELVKIHEYTGIPYSDLINGVNIDNIKSITNELQPTTSGKEKELREIIELLREQISMYKEKINELNQNK